jgi:hypothetical protein
MEMGWSGGAPAGVLTANTAYQSLPVGEAIMEPNPSLSTGNNNLAVGRIPFQGLNSNDEREGVDPGDNCNPI